MAITNEQREIRRSGIGGSDVAAIVGISPWKTPHDIWEQKLDIDQESLEESDALIFGTLVEPVLRGEFSRRNPDLLVKENPDIIRHPDYPYFLANVDGDVFRMEDFADGEIAELAKKYGWEGKTSSEYAADGWGVEGTDQIPDYYQTQCQWYCGVCGWEGCYVSVLIGGNKYRQYYIPRDDELINSLFAICGKFWNDHVLTKIPPPKTLTELNETWKATTGGSKEVGSEVLDKISALSSIKAQIDSLSKEAKDIERDVKDAIGDNDEITVGGKKVASWKFNKSSMRFSADKLKTEDPDTYAKFSVDTPGPRVFRIFV